MVSGDGQHKLGPRSSARGDELFAENVRALRLLDVCKWLPGIWGAQTLMGFVCLSGFSPSLCTRDPQPEGTSPRVYG